MHLRRGEGEDGLLLASVLSILSPSVLSSARLSTYSSDMLHKQSRNKHLEGVRGGLKVHIFLTCRHMIFPLLYAAYSMPTTCTPTMVISKLTGAGPLLVSSIYLRKQKMALEES